MHQADIELGVDPLTPAPAPAVTTPAPAPPPLRIDPAPCCSDYRRERDDIEQVEDTQPPAKAKRNAAPPSTPRLDEAKRMIEHRPALVPRTASDRAGNATPGKDPL
jgi:hypothetical protein